MEIQEQPQQPHLQLANKLFLLSHPDVQDMEKVQLREEVFASVKADGKSNH
jgi:26S proteasome regulatory subunit N7